MCCFFVLFFGLGGLRIWGTEMKLVIVFIPGHERRGEVYWIYQKLTSGFGFVVLSMS